MVAWRSFAQAFSMPPMALLSTFSAEPARLSWVLVVAGVSSLAFLVTMMAPPAWQAVLLDPRTPWVLAGHLTVAAGPWGWSVGAVAAGWHRRRSRSWRTSGRVASLMALACLWGVQADALQVSTAMGRAQDQATAWVSLPAVPGASQTMTVPHLSARACRVLWAPSWYAQGNPWRVVAVNGQPVTAFDPTRCRALGFNTLTLQVTAWISPARA